MKIKNNNPKNAGRAKILLLAVMFLTQLTYVAAENSISFSKALALGVLSTGNTCSYLNETASEPEAEIEDWMSNVHSSFWFDLREAKETEPAIENWMYNTENIFWLDLNNATESELALESWMYDTQDSFWLNLDEAADPEPVMESWMTNPEEWDLNDGEIMLTSN